MYERLIKICAEKGITISYLCEVVTGSKGNLTTWKKGYMRSDYLMKCAEILGVSVNYLLDFKDTIPIKATESEWEKILLHLSDESRNQLEEYIDFLLWKQNRADSISQSSCEPE